MRCVICDKTAEYMFEGVSVCKEHLLKDCRGIAKFREEHKEVNP